MKAKLNFIDEKTKNMANSVDQNTLINEKVKTAIINLLKRTNKNKATINKVVVKTIAVKNLNLKKVDEKNSLIENIMVLNDNLILMNKQITKLTADVNKLNSVYKKNKKIKGIIKCVFDKFKSPIKVFYKSIITKIIIYIAILLSSSPYVIEFLKKIFEE